MNLSKTNLGGNQETNILRSRETEIIIPAKTLFNSFLSFIFLPNLASTFNQFLQEPPTCPFFLLLQPQTISNETTLYCISLGGKREKS